MAIKIISLVTGLVTLDVYLQSQLFSKGPLYYLVSDNIFINILMIAISAAGIWLSFRSRFKSWYSYAICAAVGVFMIFLGLWGMFFDSFIYSFWNIFSPLNYVLLLQYGIVFVLCSLAFKHAKRPKNANLSAVSAAMVGKLKPVFPVPKIPHFPHTLGRESASETN